MGWGALTQVQLPGGGKLAVYEPRHARPESMSTARAGATAPGSRATRRPGKGARAAAKTSATKKARTAAKARPKKAPARTARAKKPARPRRRR
jgi:hypothetical protein